MTLATLPADIDQDKRKSSLQEAAAAPFFRIPSTEGRNRILQALKKEGDGHSFPLNSNLK
jgi:hypothetical protein